MLFHINEHGTVARNANHKIAVAVGISLRLAQKLGVNRGNLELKSAHIKVTAKHCGKSCKSVITLEKLGLN